MKQGPWGRAWAVKPQALHKKILVGTRHRRHYRGVSPEGAVPGSGTAPQGQSWSSWSLDDLTWDGRGKEVYNPAKTRPRNNNNNRFPLLCNNDTWSCRLPIS
jgi:hypothetical protein